ncbi:MAG: hypothetical protein OXG74_09160 [Acidobacteria bacterium]|nr:hypothetical protein [Acidobacteriota bacterium]
MMKRVLPVAIAALALSVGGAFAEPPNSAVVDSSGIDGNESRQLSDTEMAAVAGGAWWSAACTGAVQTAGVIVWLHGLAGNPVQQGVGLYMQQLECA